MATAIIKKATVYNAPDGSSHATAKAAEQYVIDQTVKQALGQFVAGVSINDEGVVVDGDRLAEEATLVIEVRTGLEGFLFANREAILAALTPNVEIRQRKPRAQNAKKGSLVGGAANLPSGSMAGVQ